MNLIEAIKSGRPLRRRDRDTWTHRLPDSGPCRNFTSGDAWMDQKWFLQMIAMEAEDILADDWEIQEPMVTITKKQFWHALNMQPWGYPPETDGRFQQIAKDLGLE